MRTWSPSRVVEADRVIRAIAHRVWPDDRGDLRADLVQDAWLRLLTAPAYDPASGVPFGSWVAQRATWAMQDAFREWHGRSFRPVFVELRDEYPVPPARRDPILRRRLARALRRLPRRQRRTVRDWTRPVRQVAGRDGVSESAIWVRRSTVRRTLRTWLAETQRLEGVQ